VREAPACPYKPTGKKNSEGKDEATTPQEQEPAKVAAEVKKEE